MNRDTATAMWYRRIDRHCFAAQDSSGTANRSARSASIEPARPERRVSNGWRVLLNDRRGWTIEAAADRL